MVNGNTMVSKYFVIHLIKIRANKKLTIPTNEYVFTLVQYLCLTDSANMLYSNLNASPSYKRYQHKK